MKALTVSCSVLVVVGALGSAVAQSHPGHAAAAGATSALAKLPLCFIENRGVCADEVACYVRGTDKTVFFTPEGVTFALRGKTGRWVVKLDFAGANPEVKPRAQCSQEAVISYFLGPRREWKTGVPTFSRLLYPDLWPGIDLVYSATADRLKYEFLVKPGADPARIRLRYRGATRVGITSVGSLAVETPAGRFEDAPPVAFQREEGRHAPVAVAVAFCENETEAGEAACFGFRVGPYDRTRPLVLDPALLLHCGYIGGGSTDSGLAITRDAAGCLYVAGITQSDEQTFPATVGPDPTHNGNEDAFVAKLNPQATGLVYCGYIGGNSIDRGTGIAVDAAGNAYVSGQTQSTELTFPATVGPDLTHNGGLDAFVAKLNPQGTALVYCGYVGGSGTDRGNDVAVDATGNAYLAGWSQSNEQTFPVTVGPDLTHNGGQDAFVAQVNPAGTALVYCGYIGGSVTDSAFGIALDASGNAYVVGTTQSNEQTFPATVGPDLTHNGSHDVFVAKVNPAGTALVYCGYIGGSGTDRGNDIAVDAAGNAYVTGLAASNEQTFPATVGPDLTHNGSDDAFVAKVNPLGTALVYCGYIGGSGTEHGFGIALDVSGNAYVAGETQSNEQTFPVAEGPDLTHNGSDDAFVALVNAQGTGLIYCGYIGGSASDGANGITLDSTGNAYVTGVAASSEQTFPVSVGPDLTHNGGNDAFVAKVALSLLSGSGAPRPGSQVNLTLAASDDAGRPYQVGSSLGTGPIPIDTRRLQLSPDDLLVISVMGFLPQIFSGYTGIIGTNGQARAAVKIPNATALVGLRIHSAFVTLNPSSPSGVKSVSNTFSFTIST